MRTQRVLSAIAAVSCLVFVSSASLFSQDTAQRPLRTEPAAPVRAFAQDQAVPKFIKFSGTLPATNNSTATPNADLTLTTQQPLSLTFGIYSTATGGTPLFVETQSVVPDAQGKYSVLLGSSHTDGLPTDLFIDNSARWLGVKASDGEEQPRVMLVSVPYAMKSVDSEKLGGQDAGTYVQSTDLPSKIGDVLSTQFGLSKNDLLSQRLMVKAKNAVPTPGVSPIMTVGGENGNIFRINSNGEVYSSGGYFVGAADFAESVETTSDPDAYEQGDVMVIDSTKARRVDLADKPYSSLVAGIISTKPGLLGSQYSDPNDPKLDKEVPLAVVGIVPCKVSAENGEVAIGDLLVTSATPGYAMKGTDRSKMLGAVVGKAMEPLKSGKGTILVLVTLQ